MGILLMLVGLLGLASGALKMRGHIRSRVGQSPWALAEAVVGALALAGSGLGLARVRPFAWIVVAATLVLTLSSTWVHARLVNIYMKEREESEGLRLRTYLSQSAPLIDTVEELKTE